MSYTRITSVEDLDVLYGELGGTKGRHTFTELPNFSNRGKAYFIQATTDYSFKDIDQGEALINSKDKIRKWIGKKGILRVRGAPRLALKPIMADGKEPETGAVLDAIIGSKAILVDLKDQVDGLISYVTDTDKSSQTEIEGANKIALLVNRIGRLAESLVHQGSRLVEPSHINETGYAATMMMLLVGPSQMGEPNTIPSWVGKQLADDLDVIHTQQDGEARTAVHVRSCIEPLPIANDTAVGFIVSTCIQGSEFLITTDQVTSEPVAEGTVKVGGIPHTYIQLENLTVHKPAYMMISGPEDGCVMMPLGLIPQLKYNEAVLRPDTVANPHQILLGRKQYDQPGEGINSRFSKASIEEKVSLLSKMEQDNFQSYYNDIYPMAVGLYGSSRTDSSVVEILAALLSLVKLDPLYIGLMAEADMSSLLGSSQVLRSIWMATIAHYDGLILKDGIDNVMTAAFIEKLKRYDSPSDESKKPEPIQPGNSNQKLQMLKITIGDKTHSLMYDSGKPDQSFYGKTLSLEDNKVAPKILRGGEAWWNEGSTPTFDWNDEHKLVTLLEGINLQSALAQLYNMTFPGEQLMRRVAYAIKEKTPLNSEFLAVAVHVAVLTCSRDAFASFCEAICEYRLTDTSTQHIRKAITGNNLYARTQFVKSISTELKLNWFISPVSGLVPIYGTDFPMVSLNRDNEIFDYTKFIRKLVPKTEKDSVGRIFLKGLKSQKLHQPQYLGNPNLSSPGGALNIPTRGDEHVMSGNSNQLVNKVAAKSDEMDTRMSNLENMFAKLMSKIESDGYASSLGVASDGPEVSEARTGDWVENQGVSQNGPPESVSNQGSLIDYAQNIGNQPIMPIPSMISGGLHDLSGKNNVPPYDQESPPGQPLSAWGPPENPSFPNPYATPVKGQHWQSNRQYPPEEMHEDRGRSRFRGGLSSFNAAGPPSGNNWSSQSHSGGKRGGRKNSRGPGSNRGKFSNLSNYGNGRPQRSHSVEPSPNRHASYPARPGNWSMQSRSEYQMDTSPFDDTSYAQDRGFYGGRMESYDQMREPRDWENRNRGHSDELGARKPRF